MIDIAKQVLIRACLMRMCMCIAAVSLSLGLAHRAAAQGGDIAPELQCLRYVQDYEHALSIPSGLLMSIAFVEAGRPQPDGKMVAWPWTVNVNGNGTFYNTKDEAVQAVRKLMEEGQRSIDVGCLQINLRYHPNAFNSIEDAFDPDTNVAYGAKFLVSLHDVQGSWPNAVERFHSSDDGRRAEYREKVLAFWNDQARSMIMDEVVAEDTDTPYHHALRDFAAAHYEQALQEYQSILDANPKDRIGLLGLAMSYEKLAKNDEANQSYARYLAVEPTNENVAAHILQAALKQPPPVARAELEDYLKAGVQRHDFLAALSEVETKMGDDQDAMTYAADAAKAAPTVAIYQLDAGVLADRLKRPAEAVAYYRQFLDLFERSPIVVDASVEGIRDRMRYLAARL